MIRKGHACWSAAGAKVGLSIALLSIGSLIHSVIAPTSALSAPSGEKLLDCACQRLCQLRLELPAEAELQRLVNGALNGYFYDLYEQTAQLQREVQTQLDQLTGFFGSG
jgi:hypothetical protein